MVWEIKKASCIGEPIQVNDKKVPYGLGFKPTKNKNFRAKESGERECLMELKEQLKQVLHIRLSRMQLAFIHEIGVSLPVGARFPKRLCLSMSDLGYHD